MRTWKPLGLLALFACNLNPNLQPDFDGVGPQVVDLQSGLVLLDLAIQPASGVSTTDAITVFFSEPLDPSTVFSDTVFIVEGEVNATFINDANTPPLIESRRAALHPVELTLKASAGQENTAISLAPKDIPLKEQTLYTLVVSAAIRDANGAPLVDALGLENAFTFRFITGNTADGSPIASLVFPAPAAGQAEAQNVPTNLPRAVVRFTKPVLGVVEGGVDQGRILLLGANKLPVSVQVRDGLTAPQVAECAGAALSQCFSVEIGEVLAPNTSHQIVLQPGITDLVGQALVGTTIFRFTTGAGPDDTPPAFLAGPDVLAQDVSATITFIVDEAGTGVVRFGQVALTSEVNTTVTDLGGGQFRHQATLAPLIAETNFNFEAQVTDFAGNTVTQAGSFTTAPQLPQIIISEVMANPQGSPESAEEFIELFNADTVAIDVGGMIIHRVQNGVDVSSGVLSGRGGGSTILQPGQFAVIGGANFNPVNFSVSPGALQLQASSLGSGLSNSSDNAYTLEAGGFIIATFTNFLPHDCNGRSIERINLSLGDVNGNSAYSDDPSGATPGRANSGSEDQQGNVCF